VVVAAGVDVFKFARVVEALLGIDAGEEEALNLVGGVQRQAFFGKLGVGVLLEHAAEIARIRLAILVDDRAEDQHLAGAEDVGRHPVEGAPVDAQAQIALFLRGKSADRGAVEGQIVVATEQKLLVVVEQVQAAFQVAEKHRDRFDLFGVSQVFQTLLSNFVGGHAIEAVGLDGQVSIFQLCVAEGQKIAVGIGHGTLPSITSSEAATLKSR